jgi:hypothetical protein
VIAFVWAIVFGGFIWLFLAGIGVGDPTPFIVGLVSGAAVFVYVRVCGESEPPPQRARRPGGGTE